MYYSGIDLHSNNFTMTTVDEQKTIVKQHRRENVAEFVLDILLLLLFALNIQKWYQFLVERQNDCRVIGTIHYLFELGDVIPLQITLRQSIANYFLSIRNAPSLNCFSLR